MLEYNTMLNEHPLLNREYLSCNNRIKHSLPKNLFSLTRLTQKSRANGFTLAEVLITLGIIGVVAAITIPTLLQNAQEKQLVTGLQKFNSNLYQAVSSWKQEIGCDNDAYTCASQQGIINDATSDFDQITKFLNVTERVDSMSGTSVTWLPSQTLDYYGNNQTGIWGGCSNASTGPARYLLTDGTTFCTDINTEGFAITVDVNGKKQPNRMGKDIFNFIIGQKLGKDIWPYANGTNAASENSTGICGYNSICDPNNVDPTVGNGASPTTYVLLNNKLPDFKALSTTVPDFKP